FRNTYSKAACQVLDASFLGTPMSRMDAGNMLLSVVETDDDERQKDIKKRERIEKSADDNRNDAADDDDSCNESGDDNLEDPDFKAPRSEKMRRRPKKKANVKDDSKKMHVLVTNIKNRAKKQRARTHVDFQSAFTSAVEMTTSEVPLLVASFVCF